MYIDICSLQVVRRAWVYDNLQKYEVKSLQFTRHGHDMLWLSRGFASESQLPVSYNAKVTNAWMESIGYEINLLNKV